MYGSTNSDEEISQYGYNKKFKTMFSSFVYKMSW